MSDEQWLLMLLAGAGAAAGGLALSQRGQSEPPSQWYRLSWPKELQSDRVLALFRHLAADRRSHILAFEVVASGGRLSYRLGVAKRQAKNVCAAIDSYLPGAATELIAHDLVHAPDTAWRVEIRPTQLALRTDRLEESARALTTALSANSSDCTVILQWLLGPRLAPMTTTGKESASGTSWREILAETITGPKRPSAEMLKSMREKTAESGFRAICRLGVEAPSAETAQGIASRLLAALRTTEAPGVRLRLRKDDPDKLAEARAPRSWPVAINVRELTALCGWPLGKEGLPGVERPRARLLPAEGAVARTGRVIGVSNYPGIQRPLALGITDSLQHCHVLGPTGTGKSTLLLSLILQDIDAGRGVAVVDPKGDLIEDVLCRVPENRRDDVVVLDPADEQRPVGLNVLQGGNRSAELIADQVLAVFHDLYRENWGPRTQDILHAALLTLAGRPGMTLCALPVLLSNPRFRRQAVGGIKDEVALKPFWHWFETLSEGERQQAIAPVMNKLRAFLLRPRMRAVIGQAEPAFGLHTIFSERKVLLVSLAKGLLGPEAAALLGSLVVSQLWQAAQGRVRVPARARAPVMIYIDEFQDYLHLPTDLSDVLAQSRGLGVGLTLAHQHLAQLPPALRSAVLANARSRICFQLGSEDARLIAASAGDIEPSDLQGLGRYEAYTALVADGNITPFASMRTLAPPPMGTDGASVRASSRERYGRDLDVIETEIAGLLGGEAANEEQPIGRRRRS